MRARGVSFPSRRTASIVDVEVRDPGPGEVLVRATTSLVSAGTEMLVYRGDANPGDLMPPNCEGSFDFPIRYGYQIVGRVEKAGAGSGFTAGDRVFARHPHQELFTTATADTWVTGLPESVSDTAGAFLNLTRVALTANLDAPVRVGEVAVVFGLGIVGMMCARLARRTAGRLIVVDPLSSRRDLALAYGADLAVTPAEAAEAVAEASDGRGADVTFEASGAPAAFQSAIELTGEYGTIAVLSYFGSRDVTLRLAPEFHWRRQRIVSSNAGRQRRWDAERRTAAVVELLTALDVDAMVSRRVPFTDAARAYELVDRHPEDVLGVILEYPEVRL